jgi:hypothetical protein
MPEQAWITESFTISPVHKATIVDGFGAERPLLTWCCGKVPNQDGQGKSR